jgi:hypothetical protein
MGTDGVCVYRMGYDEEGTDLRAWGRGVGRPVNRVVRRYTTEVTLSRSDDPYIPARISPLSSLTFTQTLGIEEEQQSVLAVWFDTSPIEAPVRRCFDAVPLLSL